jgi:hypothetical protein
MTENRIYWQIPGRVLYIKAIRDATIEDVRSDTTAIAHHMEGGKAPVHLLFDVSDLGMPPVGEDMTEALVDLFSIPAMGYTIAIGFRPQDLPILKSAGEALSQVTGKPIEFTDSLESGLAMLRKLDPTLDA